MYQDSVKFFQVIFARIFLHIEKLVAIYEPISLLLLKLLINLLKVCIIK